MPEPIEIVPYDPQWKVRFAELELQLRRELGMLDTAVEHVGSTAVAELCAKPIVDIDVVVGPDCDFAAVTEVLARLGYEHKGDLGVEGECRTAEQCAVPLLLHGAGIEPGVVTRRTSHIDLPATLLEHLGADPSLREAWTLGGNLNEEPADAEERRRVVSAWKLIGMQTPGGHVLRVPLHDASSFRVEVYDERWQLEVDDEEILQRERGQLERLAAQCTRFLVQD